MSGDGLRLAEVSGTDDPEGLHRVQLRFAEDEQGAWARVAGFSASSGSGAVFAPEIGDEVIVGTLAGGEPVVLGSLYNDRNRPPAAAGPGNDLKTFVSRGRLSLAFDDDRGVIRLETPSGQRVILDEAAHELRLEDGSNEVVLSRDGISLRANMGVSIRAMGPVTIEGQSVAITSATSLEAEAPQVRLHGHGSLSAVSDAQLDLRAAAVATLRGALVEIN